MNPSHTLPPTPLADVSDKINLQAWVKSDVGRVRKNNEDNYLSDTVNGLFAVADGMGGHEHGELASQRAVEAIKNYLHNVMSGLKAFTVDPSPERKAWVSQVIQGAVRTANADVYRLATQKGAQSNMGTTLSMILFLNKHSAVIGHVGDSRIYMIRNKEVKQVTEDQTFLQQQIRKGLVRPEDAANVPYGHTLLQAVGYRPDVEPAVQFVSLEPGDQFLICSDGLSNYLLEDEIVTVFSQSQGEQIVPRLIDCANARGGKDNITAVAIRLADPSDSQAATQLDLTSGLTSCPLFNGLQTPEVMSLLPVGKLKVLIRDEILQTEGHPGNGLYVLLSGSVGLYRRNAWLTSVGPGGSLGEVEFFDERECLDTAVCEEEVRAILFPYDKLREFIKDNQNIGFHLQNNLANQLASRVRNHVGRLSQLLSQG
jgi:serine/threonine protein phosphatase PrpC